MRMSTRDQQTLLLQMHAMREYAAKRGWTVSLQIKEVGPGASQRELREKFLDAARRREIDVVLVWRLERIIDTFTAAMLRTRPHRRSSTGLWRQCFRQHAKPLSITFIGTCAPTWGSRWLASGG
jgi:hypothetical protein